MKKDPYKLVAKIYDHLMKTISYHEWGRYIVDLKEFYNVDAKSFLEIAAGSGKLAFYLERIFPNLVLLDISQSMLANIDREKNRICADMTMLPFKNNFDFIYSTFDSINYIMDEKALQQYFAEVNSILSSNGVFTFDASLENNSIKNVNSLNRTGKFQNIIYTQNSEYNYDTKIHLNKFKVKLENGKIFEEVHLQKIYNFELYFEFADNAGLKVVDCFEAFTFDDASSESERIQFVMKKI